MRGTTRTATAQDGGLPQGPTPVAAGGSSSTDIRYTVGMIRLCGSAVLAALLCATLSIGPVRSGDKTPMKLVKRSDRQGKKLFKAVYGKDGRLGAFYDVDHDGHLEFVSLHRDENRLDLIVLELDTDEESLRVNVGTSAPAGIVALNLDDDESLEYIVGYGSRAQERAKKGLVLFASAVGASLYTSMLTDPVSVTPPEVTVYVKLSPPLKSGTGV